MRIKTKKYIELLEVQVSDQKVLIAHQEELIDRLKEENKSLLARQEESREDGRRQISVHQMLDEWLNGKKGEG